MSNAWSLSALLLVIAVLLAACGAPQIETSVMIPPKAPQVMELRKIAVIPFAGYRRFGSSGEEATTEMESLLAGIKVRGKPHYFLVDRAETSRLTKEMAFGSSGFVDEKTAAKIGSFIGAEAIMTGKVHQWQVKNESYRSQSRTCRKQSAVLEMAVKVIDVQSSRVIYAQTHTASRTFDTCDSLAQLKVAFSGDDPRSASELMIAAKKELRETWLQDFAPGFTTMTIPLMDNAAGIESGQGRIALKSGIKFALNDRLDRACDTWKQALSSESKSPALLYNFGVCNEVNGERQKALELYQQADRLLMEPVDYVGEALKRVRVSPAGR